eukprot:TRINITY_DN814_c1_g3_i1.p1 TRINITY_DN814_c1_g3~~TRINITY_DN814_c1_g3_i1.p1  ORF type:complete len:394 (-),score=117.97 TRINITY_DN814_c1_g3_i1:9-1190(-)
MPHGQLVIGPPGSGKTTYCSGMLEFLTAIERKAVVINLDPANDILPYPCNINITDLIDLNEVMEKYKLGPNGGLMYCIEYLEKNIDWLFDKMEEFEDKIITIEEREIEKKRNELKKRNSDLPLHEQVPKGIYWIIDCPGQVELYTHHKSFRNIIKLFTDELYYNFTAINLIDSFYCSDLTIFVSVLITSLNMMLCLELPHINVLSKIDLIEQLGKLAFNLDFFTNVLDLEFLLDYLDTDWLTKRYKTLNKALCKLIEDHNLVAFQTLNIQDKESVYSLLKVIDKSNGYIYGAHGPGTTPSFTSIYSVADTGGMVFAYDQIGEIQEKYMNFDDHYFDNNDYDNDDDDNVEEQTVNDVDNEKKENSDSNSDVENKKGKNIDNNNNNKNIEDNKHE